MLYAKSLSVHLSTKHIKHRDLPVTKTNEQLS